MKKSMVSGFKMALLAGTAASSLIMPNMVFAQTATAAADTTDNAEIFVIARKKLETLQEVPVTVTAIGAETLERYEYNQIADVVSRIPTLNVQVGGSGSGGQISLRGVGSSNISAAFDSAVAFDFDGIQVSTARIVQAGFFDVKQIEVLKGPQSLFFGKSASAGVVSLRSADPTKNWEVGGKASYEFEEKGYTVGGYISGPLTSTLGVRVAAQLNDVSEFVKIAPGTPALLRTRGNTDFVARGTLQWDPASNFSANLKANYVRNTNDGAIGLADIDCGPNGRADEVVLLGGAIAIPSNADCKTHDNFYPVSDPSSTQTTKFPDGSAGANGRYPGHPFGQTDIFFSRLKWDWNLSDKLTLSSVTGYFNLHSVDFDSYSYVGVGAAFNPNGVPVSAIAPRLGAANAAGSAQGFGSSDPENKIDQFTQEVRLSTNLDGKFNFTVGAFYEKRVIDFNTSQQGVNISIIALDPITGNSYDWYKKHHTKSDAFSVWGSGILNLTDQLELSGGLRYTHEKKVNTITVPYVHLFLSSGPAFIDSGFFSGPINFKDNNFSPEVTLKYKPSEDINLYAAFKTGFKSGGIDNSALPSSNLLGIGDLSLLAGDPQGRTVDQAVKDGLIFKSETAKGGEVGVKTQFADRSITLNASAFYYVFKNLQVQNFNATTIQFVTFNASELTTKGVDLDFAWRTQVPGLSFTGAAALTDAKYTKPFLNLLNRKAARAPTFAGNIGFDWRTPVNDAIEVSLNGNLAYTGSYFTAQTSLTDIKQAAFATVDGAISVGNPDGKWKLSLIGVNIGNKIYANSSGGRPFLAGPGLGLPVGDDSVVTNNRGRQIFVEASFKF